MQLEKVKKTEKQTSIFDDKIKYVANFLLEHYEIRVSVQDPSKKYIKCKDTDRKHIEPNFREISLHLASNGYTVGDATLRKIMSSPYYIPHCDPIKEYFDKIEGKWKGQSQIDLLCQHIKVRAFDDNTPEFYTQRAYNLIRKWLVACLATWLGDDPYKQNDVCLGLIQAAGGAGKSSLARFLLPKELEDYYMETSDDDRKFDMENDYCRFMLINYEETAGLKKSTINTFKKCQSAAWITTKQRNEEFASKKKRIGCSFLNTNFNQENGGFIQPWYGSDTRRFGLIEITDIDQNYSNKVDIDQLWSEALTLYKSSSFNYVFEKVPDFVDFNIYNARYKNETNAMKILQRSIRHPESGEEGEKLNPTQIMQRLIQLRKIKSDEMKDVTPQRIGQALGILGYEQISYRSKSDNNESRKGYHIQFLE